METVLILVIVALMLLTGYCVWRMIGAFRSLVPAVATIRNGGYSERMREDDADRRWLAADGCEYRRIEDRIAFEDTDGTPRLAWVKRHVMRGQRPDEAYMIWYALADPARVTTFGPWHWLLSTLTFAGMLAAIVDVILTMGRTG